ncbi:hypothetical protein CGQ24_08350 [Arthrobacter sp. 7749]|nr:hypothetical protein CGQ24_08350 [Arthrobacter sp. 7749]
MTTNQPTHRPGQPLRAVLYLRQSVSREESISLELQETAGRAYAQQQGYGVVAVESDPGISGRTWKRPAVQRVMAMIEEGRVDVIVLWKWSRLSRSRLDWAVAADKVETAGGRIESATEPLDVSTSTGRLARGMLTEFAAFESERIGDGWKEAQARRVKQGLPGSGKARFGYSYNRETGFTPDTVTGPVLAELYRRYINGEGFLRLAGWLNELGHPTPTGYTKVTGEWSETTVRRVLDSGFGASYIIHHKKKLPGAHRSVITESEWAEYLTRRAARHITRSGTNSSYLLTGMLYCGNCNGRMFGTTRHPNYYYRCHSCARVRSRPGVTISGAKSESAVLDWLKGLAKEINKAADAVPAPPPIKSDPLPALRRTLIKASNRLDTLTMKFLDGTIPEDTYERMRDTIIGEREATEARIREEELAQAKPESSFVPGLVENWDELPIHVKRDLLSRVVGRVEVEPSPRANVVNVRGKWEL